MRDYSRLCLLFFSALLYFFAANPSYDVDPDTWTYMLIAKSFSIGNGYRFASHPDNPHENLVLPLYPLILVSVYWYAKGSFLVACMVSALIATLSVYLFYLVSLKYFEKNIALMSTALISLSPMMIIYSHKILTEIPYLFFSLLTVYLVSKYSERKDIVAYAFVLPLLLSLFTKISGIMLMTSIVLYFLVRGDYKKFFITALVFLLFIGFLSSISYYHFFAKNVPGVTVVDELTGKRVSLGSTFLDYMRDRARSGVARYFGWWIPSNILTLLLIIQGNTALFFHAIVIGSIISVISFVGYLANLRGGLDIFNIYLPIHSFVIVFLMSLGGNGRYMLPVLPLVVIYFIVGLHTILPHVKILRTEITLFTSVLYLLVFFSISSAIGLSYSAHNKENTKTYDNLLATAGWFESDVGRSDIIATNFRYVQPVYLFTGNKVVQLNSDYGLALAEISKYRISYLLIHDSHAFERSPNFSEDFGLVYTTSDSEFKVYKRADPYKAP